MYVYTIFRMVEIISRLHRHKQDGEHDDSNLSTTHLWPQRSTTGLSCSKGSTSRVSVWRGPCSSLGLDPSTATFGWVWRRSINWPNHLRQVSALRCSPRLANGFPPNMPGSSWMQKRINTPSTWPGFPGIPVTSWRIIMEWNSVPPTVIMIWARIIVPWITGEDSGITHAWISTWTAIQLPTTAGWIVSNITSPSVGWCSSSTRPTN